jgi:hypothetical protein
VTAAQLFVLILVFGYVGSRLIFSRIQLPRREQHFFLMGGEYLLAGFLLGPSVLNVLSRDILQSLSPVIFVGIGWLGMLLGIQLPLRNLRRFPPAMFLFLLVENVVFLALMVGSIWLFQRFRLLGFRANGEFLLIWLGALAATSPTALAVLSRQFRVPMRFTFLARFLSSLDGLFAILFVGIVYGLVHPEQLLLGISPGKLGWILLSVGLGTVGAFFFHWMLFIVRDENEMILVSMGVIVYAAGVALLFRLSPLFVAFVLGAVLANLSTKETHLSHLLSATEKPFYIVFLIFAGSLVEFSHPGIPLAAVLLYVLRLLWKIAGNATATLVVKDLRSPQASGLPLCSIAGLSLAIALEYAILFPGEASSYMLGTFVVLVVVNQMISPLILRTWIQRVRS